MRKLLDSVSQRVLSILEILFTSEDWITTHQISTMLHISEKTINTDLHFIKRHWGSLTNIELSRQQGVKIHNQSIAIFGKILMEIFQGTPALFFLELLLFHPFQKSDFYLEKLHVSQSSFSRIVHRTNHFFQKII